jgi:hypothetical protein
LWKIRSLGSGLRRRGVWIPQFSHFFELLEYSLQQIITPRPGVRIYFPDHLERPDRGGLKKMLNTRAIAQKIMGQSNVVGWEANRSEAEQCGNSGKLKC